MATKKGSKTAHVLNVLSNPKQEPVEETATEEAATEKAAEGEVTPKAAPSRPVRVPILEVARANDDALSEQIRDLLEEDLLREETVQKAEEIKPPPPIADLEVPDEKPEALPKEEPPQFELDKVEEVEPAPMPEPEPTKTSAPAEPATLQETIKSTKPVSNEPEDDFSYVNIMEALVEEKCMKYIRMFGLCTCSRCVADVKALALSNLPPKYSVMQKGEVIPMLTVFEGRFNSALTAQILNACKVVMEHPRHEKA